MWTGGGGGGVEYYNAYGYQGMSVISTSDEFVFAANGSYQSTHNSANMSGGGAVSPNCNIANNLPSAIGT